MVKEFAARKELITGLMKKIEGFEFANPDGAFYAFPCVDHYFGKSDGEETIQNADDLCMYLLNKGHVSTVTGSAFGDERSIRISFANSREKISRGFEKISAALGKLK